MHKVHQALEQNTAASRYGLPRNARRNEVQSLFFGSIYWNSPAGRAIAGEELPGSVTWEDTALSDKADVFCRARGNDKSWKVVASVSPSSLARRANFLEIKHFSWVSNKQIILATFTKLPLSRKANTRRIPTKIEAKLPWHWKSHAWAEPGVVPFSLIC